MGLRLKQFKYMGIIAKLMKRNKLKPDLEYRGHKFYALDPGAGDDNPRKLTVSRALVFLSAINTLTLNIQREDLEAYMNKVDEALDKKDLERVRYLNYILRVRQQLKGFEGSYIELGMACVLIDDEKDPTKETDDQKRELAKESHIVSSFFLSVAIRCLHNSRALENDIQIEDYFKSQEYREVVTLFGMETH